MKRTLLAALLAATGFNAQALTTGDIAFSGFNADMDGWAIVTFADIAANTTIYFSDNEWNGAAFADTNEHALAWNTGAATIAAGTVVLFTEIDGDGGADVIEASFGTLGLAAGAGTNLGLSASDETLYAYLGGDALNPTAFLAAVTTESTTANVTNAGLTVFVNAVALTNSTDYAEYVGVRSGYPVFDVYAATVNDANNWNIVVGGDNAALIPDATVFTVAVPEAETYAMMLAGLGLVGLMARRRKA
jgi:hypothetical protein